MKDIKGIAIDKGPEICSKRPGEQDCKNNVHAQREYVVSVVDQPNSKTEWPQSLVDPGSAHARFSDSKLPESLLSISKNFLPRNSLSRVRKNFLARICTEMEK